MLETEYSIRKRLKTRISKEGKERTESSDLNMYRLSDYNDSSLSYIDRKNEKHKWRYCWMHIFWIFCLKEKDDLGCEKGSNVWIVNHGIIMIVLEQNKKSCCIHLQFFQVVIGCFENFSEEIYSHAYFTVGTIFTFHKISAYSIALHIFFIYIKYWKKID